jgi:hypothetical protein
MRVYLPSTLRALAAALAGGDLGPPPVRGYAVTPALREWYSSGDLEELEYVAMSHAARDSLRLLRADPAAARRRVVLAAELPDGQVRPAGFGDVSPAGVGDPGQVEVLAPIGMRLVVSGHVDDAAAGPDVAAAVAALPAADDGDDDARFVVDGALGHDLMWYATQELPDLLGEQG